MARISSYQLDGSLSGEDRLLGSSYEGEGQSGPIYKTRTYKLSELGAYVSTYVNIEGINLQEIYDLINSVIGDINNITTIVNGNTNSISLISTTVTDNSVAIATANQSLTVITNELMAQATFQTNLAASFGTYDEFGNLTSFSEATANQILQVTTSERYANAQFVTNLAASVGTFDENGNLITLSQGFANQVLQTTTTDQYASAQFVTNLAASIGTYNPDGTLASISSAFAEQSYNILAKPDYAEASFVNNLGASIGTLNPDGTLQFNINSSYSQGIKTYIENNSAIAESIETLQATYATLPQTIRQPEPPTILEFNPVTQQDELVYPLGSIWVDTDDNNALYVLIEDPSDPIGYSWSPTTSEALGDLILSNSQLQSEVNLLSDELSSKGSKLDKLTSQFGVYDPLTDTFTIDNNAAITSSLRTYADSGSAAASKIDNINSTLNILDANGNIIKNSAQFLSDIRTDVDANSATASKVDNLNSTLNILDANGNIIKNESQFKSDISTYVDNNSATASKVDNLNSTLNILDANGNILKNTATFLQDIRTDVDTNSATAQAVTNLTATIGDENSGLVANVQTASNAIADLETGVKASYGLTVGAGNAISSMKLLAEDPLQPGLPSTSSIVFNTGTFKIQNGSGVDQFTINTTTGKAVFSGSLQAVDGTFTGTLQAGDVTISNNLIEIDSTAGVLRFIDGANVGGQVYSANGVLVLDANTQATMQSPDGFVSIAAAGLTLSTDSTLNMLGQNIAALASTQIQLSVGQTALTIGSSGVFVNGTQIGNAPTTNYYLQSATIDTNGVITFAMAGGIPNRTLDISTYVSSVTPNLSGYAALSGATFTGNVIAPDFVLSSDATLKENIKDYTAKPINIQYKEYNLIGDDSLRVGVIAQELEKDHPEFVKITDNGTKAVSYIDMLVAKVAELEQRIKQLENGAA